MIKITDLKRDYDEFVAVNHVSFSIEKGEIVGLLGHNGAGKTTIMKMISGYLEPNAGHIEIDGLDLAEQRTAIQQRIGYLPEVLPIYPEMSVADYLDYATRVKGLSGEEADSEIRRVVRSTDIAEKLLAPIATLSRGFKQRIGVAQAILGNPKLLILDEPTNGLDPTQTQQMRELIRDIAKKATVIISTHIMQEVDALCDRVLIMRAGELALDARLDELRNSNRLVLHSDIDSKAVAKLIQPIAGVESIHGTEHQHYRITLDPQQSSADCANRIAHSVLDNQFSLYELKREQRDLESVFREVNEQSNEEVRDAA